jgi:hypothetical protein
VYLLDHFSQVQVGNGSSWYLGRDFTRDLHRLCAAGRRSMTV